MQDSTTKPAGREGLPVFGPDTIEAEMRQRVRATIEAIVHEELEAALGARKSARVGDRRAGYRHGSRERPLTTSLGPGTITMPRARVRGGDGTTSEWRSETVRRYQRRNVRVDEAILGVYLAGTNTRRLKGALAPLLRGGPLSKDAVSRLVGRLRDDFETWRGRGLADEDIRYLFLDGWFPNLRIGGRRERVPVLVTLGVRGDGQRVVLDLRLAGEESAAVDVDQAASAGMHQDTESAGHGKPLFTCNADAQLLIHQQQIGVLLLGELDSVAFPRIEFRERRVNLGHDVANNQPGRHLRQPVTHGRTPSRVIEFFDDGHGHQHPGVQRRQEVFATELDEVVQRRGIGDDNDHDDGIRPLTSSRSRVSRSCARSSTSYACSATWRLLSTASTPAVTPVTTGWPDNASRRRSGRPLSPRLQAPLARLVTRRALLQP